MSATVARSSPIQSSLLVHAALAVIMLLLLASPLVTPIDRTIEVDLRETAPAAEPIVRAVPARPAASRPAHATPARKTRHAVPAVTLESLGLKIDLNAPGRASVTLARPSINFAREGRDLKLYEYLYHSIDTRLAYPAEFIDQRMEGTVSARISFNGTGHFLENETEYHTDLNYFRVLVARTLRQAFAEPIPADKLTLHEKFDVFCSFRFEIKEPNYAGLETDPKFALENGLHFYRNAHKTRFNPSFGPLKGIGTSIQPTSKGSEIAPVANFDALWLPGKVIDLFSGKPKKDALRKYKDDPAW